MLRRRPPSSALGATPRPSHAGAAVASGLLLALWVCVTLSADTLAPWIGARAAAVEVALGLDAAIPLDEDDE